MVLYKVPIIQPDLRHEEAIVQSLNSLEYLNDVINEVFDKINTRISTNSAKVQDISHRIDVASRKIESLKDTKKAISFYCPAKYPGKLEDFVEVFTETKLYVKRPGEIQSPLRPIRDGKPLDKLQFFHVAITEGEPKAQKTKSRVSVPLEIITSVDSLLIFQDDDKKSKTPSASSAFVDSGSKKLEAAPVSIMNKGHTKALVDDIFYSPTVDEAPELEFPLDIPDLPGVAGDISFTDDDFLTIATPTKILKVEEPKPESKTPTVIAQPVIQPNIPTPAPRALAPDTVGPPPPPPPPPLLPTLDSPAAVPVAVKSNPVPDESAARSNLMAAIRNAGGKMKLRAAADRVPEMQTKKKEKAEPAGDLMSDLRNRLSMRRKGISGAKTEPEGLMGKISALIPPPPPLDISRSDDPSDEDWN